MSNDDDVDPYTLEENYLRTDGRDCCHWCYLRPQEWVWGPYGTRVCDLCDQLATQGRAAEIVEEVDARMTVRGGWHPMIRDPEGRNRRELEALTRWLEVRTDRRAVTPPEPSPPQDYELPPGWDSPDEPFDPHSH